MSFNFERYRLSDGTCYCRLSGPPQGPVLLMIHGATVPGWEFDRLVPFLNRAGFRTLAPDLFGHGYSDRPRVAYDYSLFTRQMAELLDVLSLDSDVHLFGHSMGAAVASRLVLQDPGRFGRLVLAAPLVDFTSNTASTRFLTPPLLGELMMSACVKPLLMRRRRLRYQSIEDGRWVGKFREQIQIPGFGRALLSMFRSGTLGNQLDIYAEIERYAPVALVLRGNEDTIVSREQWLQMQDRLPSAEYREIHGTPHAFIITHPELLAPPIIDFLQSTRSDAAA
jgi:pimeloyl-ACP methyl ester carboxylesterase